MPFQNILKKASKIILGTWNGQVEPSFNEGEVVFCKNNVCVHPPALLRQASDVVHHPGYLTVSCQLGTGAGIGAGAPQLTPTLYLSWIPNSTLRKYPGAIRSRSRDEKHDGCLPTAPNTNPDGASCSDRESCQKCSTDERLEAAAYRSTYLAFRRRSSGGDSLESSQSVPSAGPALREVPVPVPDACHEDSRETPTNLDEALEGLTLTPSVNWSGSTSASASASASPLPSPAVSRPHPNRPNRIRYDPVADTEGGQGGDETIICIVEGGGEGEADACGSQREQRSPSTTSACSLLVPNQVNFIATEDAPSWLSSPELLALRHNLTFPESATAPASPVVRKTRQCRRFSVDLGQMRSLRLFFNDPECTSGQLVVASRESQYKILHFHRGGLDRLASVLNEWSFLLNSKQQQHTGSVASDTLPYRHFMVCRPEVSVEELHPEEGTLGIVDLDVWIQVLNPEGQVEDDLFLRKGIFFGGLDPSLRSVVWPFLLRCYSFQSTYDEREQQQELLVHEYQDIARRRMELSGPALAEFTRNVLCVVDEDVVRTDRGNPYFAGPDNPNIQVMKNILVNYAFYNSESGYSQGMSDLLAPVLAEIKNEAISFWCFVGLMQRASFVCTPTDGNMDRSLTYLRELLRVMLPRFYAHLEKYTDAMELLFCHRWILLCFKREFPESIALSIWEACWANYLTDYFHLFLCLSIISVYADDVIAQDLHTDEMLLYFSSLAMYMDGQLILRKARGLLHQFRQKPQIPCTLAGLCRRCGPGMWDSTHNPVVVCSGKDCVVTPCPYISPQE